MSSYRRHIERSMMQFRTGHRKCMRVKKAHHHRHGVATPTVDQVKTPAQIKRRNSLVGDMLRKIRRCIGMKGGVAMRVLFTIKWLIALAILCILCPIAQMVAAISRTRLGETWK